MAVTEVRTSQGSTPSRGATSGAFTMDQDVPFQCSISVCTWAASSCASEVQDKSCVPMYPTAQMSVAETAAMAVSWSPPSVAALPAFGLLTMDHELPFQCSVSVVGAAVAAVAEEPTAQTSVEETAATPASWVLAADAPPGTRAALSCQVGAHGAADPPPEREADGDADGEGVRTLVAELHPAARVRIAIAARGMPQRSSLLTPASPTLTTTETGGGSPRLRPGDVRRRREPPAAPGDGCAQMGVQRRPNEAAWWSTREHPYAQMGLWSHPPGYNVERASRDYAGPWRPLSRD